MCGVYLYFAINPKLIMEKQNNMKTKVGIKVGQVYGYSEKIKNQKGLTDHQKSQLKDTWVITRVINGGGKNYIETSPRINQKRTQANAFLKYAVLLKEKK